MCNKKGNLTHLEPMTDPKFLLEIPHCIARQLDEDLGIDLMASDPPRSGESLQVSWWIGASACSPCPSPSAMRRSKPETRRSAAAAYEPERRRSPGAAVQEPMRAQQKKNQGRDKATSCCSGATKYSKGRIVHLQGIYSANSFFNGVVV